jgi:glyoxylase-like metal-dependent hydrolase (beta-lactamase superfamily II)
MPEIATWQIPIGHSCFMVGRRNPHSVLQCNTYLRTFLGEGSPVHWCVDPGSRIDFPHIRSHLQEHIGNLSALRLFSINHQDPDVVGNLHSLVRANPRISGLTSEDTWRLVRHLNLKPKHLFFVNKVKRHMVSLLKGQHIQVVPTPFCHFRGAMAFYDPDNRVLFSGDLFGGLNAPGRIQLYGEEADWPGIAQFHQIYMPTREALAYAIRQIRALKPAVEYIAPQHGFVLQGGFMHAVMDRLERLPVGLDLLAAELDERYLPDYQEVLLELLETAGRQLGRDEILLRLRKLPREHELNRLLKISGAQVALRKQGIRALPMMIDVLSREQHEEFRSLLMSCVLQGCTQRQIPLPQVGIGLGKVESVAIDEQGYESLST